jgi:hypothetical protein
MQRFFTGMLGFLVLFLLSGCTSYEDAFNRLAQKSRAVLHSETNAPVQAPPTAEICLLDPVASVLETTSPAPATDKAPVVQVPETTHDFGTMGGGKEFVHKFSIKNVGTSELEIKKVVPG